MSRMHMSRKAGNALSFGLLLALAGTPTASQEIVSREEWHAKPPTMRLERHTPRMITVHHTATRQRPELGITRKLQALQAFSQRNELLADGTRKEAWADVPYHYYIAANGNIAEGRDAGYIGDTNTAYDPTGHLAIVLEGNFDLEMPTDDQMNSLTKLMGRLASEYGITVDDVGYHRNFVATACPGENLISELPSIIREALDHRHEQ